MEAAGLSNPPGNNADAALVVDPAESVAIGQAPVNHRRWSRAEDDRRNQRTVELLTQAADQSLAEADRQHCIDLAVQLNLPMAEALARRYRSAGEELDDLIQVARLGLVQAANRFNPEIANFAAFAVPTIAGEIKRHFRDHFWSTPRPPRRLQELHRQANDAWSELAQETGHIPDTAELANRVGAHPDLVREAMVTSPFNSTSLDSPTDTVPAARERIGTPEPGFQAVEDALERIQLARELRRAIAGLSETDQLILHLRFGQDQKQSEIAAKLGTNQMSISRRLTKITQILRDKLTMEVEESTQRRSTSGGGVGADEQVAESAQSWPPSHQSNGRHQPARHSSRPRMACPMPPSTESHRSAATGSPSSYVAVLTKDTL